jgi:endonuclease-3 related protein
MESPARHVYRRLHAALGPQGWWPAETPFEVMVGAVLVQNAAWTNVERAIARLREADLLEPRRLARAPRETVEQLVRSAGYYRQKSRRLQILCEWLLARCDGQVDRLRDAPLGRLRAELLGLHGIGPETADSILLYALELPALVVDAYTRRIWVRHGWIAPPADYHALQRRLADDLPVDVLLYNELHALVVQVGKDYCKKRRPACDACPLADLLPDGGPGSDER